MLSYGEVIEMWVGPKKTYVITCPDMLEEILKQKAKNFPKNTPGYKKVSDVIGDGVFTEVGEKWKQIRKIVNPFFNPKNFDFYTQVVNHKAQDVIAQIEELPDKEQVPISRLINTFTLKVLGESMFGQDFGPHQDRIEKEFASLVDLTEKKLTQLDIPLNPLQWWENKKFNSSLNAIDELIQEIIDSSKSNQKKNFVSAFLKSELYADIAKSSKKEANQFLIAQIKTMVFAGHETTANVLSWITNFLCVEQEHQTKIRDDLTKLRQTYPENTFELATKSFPSQDILWRSMYEFASESMRMRPPAWSFGRIALEDDNIKGLKIKKGETVTISPYLCHHDPKRWDSPLKFDPSRFRPEAEKRLHPLSYFPFGAGPRICIGKQLAWMEIMGLMYHLLSKYQLKFARGQSPLEMSPQISLRPASDLYISVKKIPD